MNLDRFITAQRDTYAAALSELHAGWKYEHWMWFIFTALLESAVEGIASNRFHPQPGDTVLMVPVQKRMHGLVAGNDR